MVEFQRNEAPDDRNNADRHAVCFASIPNTTSHHRRVGLGVPGRDRRSTGGGRGHAEDHCHRPFRGGFTAMAAAILTTASPSRPPLPPGRSPPVPCVARPARSRGAADYPEIMIQKFHTGSIRGTYCSRSGKKTSVGCAHTDGAGARPAQPELAGRRLRQLARPRGRHTVGHRRLRMVRGGPVVPDSLARRREPVRSEGTTKAPRNSMLFSIMPTSTSSASREVPVPST